MNFENLNFAELKVLFSTLHMFKFGVDDEEKRLFMIGSSVYKDLLNASQEAYLKAGQQHQPQFSKEVTMDIDNHPEILEQLKNYIVKWKSGIHYWDDFYWRDLSVLQKRDVIINFAYPYSINEKRMVELMGSE